MHFVLLQCSSSSYLLLFLKQLLDLPIFALCYLAELVVTALFSRMNLGIEKSHFLSVTVLFSSSILLCLEEPWIYCLGFLVAAFGRAILADLKMPVELFMEEITGKKGNIYCK